MWNNIIGQKKVIEKIKSVYKSGKVSHAYLFEGIEGVGKDAAAIEFAKLLNCKNVLKGDEACDKCDSCIKISSFRSEYFKIICALPAGKSEETDSDPIERLTASDFDSYVEQFRLKSENPYHQIILQNANNIRINSIRDLVSKIYLSAPSGYKKIFLVSGADKMRQEAANALLKILEEPPKNSVIILTTSKVNSLPQTIIGRCQRIHFDSLNEEQIRTKLLGKTEYTAKQIELAAKLCQGSYTRAARLLEMGIDEIRENVMQYLLSLLKNNYAETVLISRNITAKNDKEKTKYFLFILNIWLRDLMLVKNLAVNTNKITNFDLVERLTKLNNNYPQTDIFGIIMELEEAEKQIGQNVQLTLILVNLSFKLKKLFK